MPFMREPPWLDTNKECFIFLLFFAFMNRLKLSCKSQFAISFSLIAFPLSAQYQQKKKQSIPFFDAIFICFFMMAPVSPRHPQIGIRLANCVSSFSVELIGALLSQALLHILCPAQPPK